VREALAKHHPLPYTSIKSGLSLGYVIEVARRWSALAKEMNRAGATVVEELGNERVAFWESQLGPGAITTAAPLAAAKTPTPIVRHYEAPSARPPTRRKKSST